MKEGVKKNHSKLDKILDGVEKLGNRVPHPAIIFLMLIVFVAVLSQIFQMMGRMPLMKYLIQIVDSWNQRQFT